MCSPASFVLTRDQIFWSMRTDSHDAIIAEFSLHADGVRGPNIVRVEITPPREDMREPASKWNYKLDQDEKPDWYDAVECEKRTRIALDEWIASRVIRGSDTRDCRRGVFFAFDNSTVSAEGNATVKADDRATVYAYDHSTVDAREDVTVHALNNAKVRAHANAIVKAYDSAKVYAHDNVTVEACDDVTVYAHDSATVAAHEAATVYAHHNVTVEACDDVTVYAHDNATVEVRGRATVNQYGGTVAPPKDNAVVIDRRDGKSVCVVTPAPCG